MGGPGAPNYTAMKRMALAKKNSSASVISTKVNGRTTFAICVNNAAYPASLELHKIYRVLPDLDAEQDDDLRVIDESGEDYLYPSAWFICVEFPPHVKRALRTSFAHSAQPA